MKKHTNVSRPSVAKPNASKNVALLLAGVSGLALLTGCSLADIKNPFASQRPEQIIPENRRMPVLNTALPSAPPAMAHPEAPMVTTAVPPSARVNVAKKDTAVRKHIPGNPSGTLPRPEMASHAAPVPAEPPVLPTNRIEVEHHCLRPLHR